MLLINVNVSAKTSKRYVIPGGDSIGLQINTGVIISGKFEVKTNDGKKQPWENSDIQVNDTIISINGNLVNTITDIQKIISKMKNNEIVEMVLLRNGKNIKTSITLVESLDGKLSFGLYVKDKILGVGTLTYIDPTDNTFASLGHSVYSKSSGLDNSSLRNISGEIVSTRISGIRKAVPGIPGEKRAILDDDIKGIITNNNDYGVFGIYTDPEIKKHKTVPVGQISDIKIGKATIITVIGENVKENYDIEIIELKNQVIPDVKGIKFKVTDERLINETGGIIQGMSGSPIMQNGKIIGAVSHVVVDTPEYGYGVYLEWMLKNN